MERSPRYSGPVPTVGADATWKNLDLIKCEGPTSRVVSPTFRPEDPSERRSNEACDSFRTTHHEYNLRPPIRTTGH